MHALFLLASTALILLSATFFLLIRRQKEVSGLPPGPRGLPILGYLPFLRPTLHHQFTQLAQKYGPIYSLRLGSKLCVVISSPGLVKQVVRDHDAVFANRDPPIAAIVATGGMDILWSPHGPYWRDMRKLFVREMLSNNNLQATYTLRREEVREAVRSVDRRAGSEAVEIGELVFRTELNVVMSLLWGGAMDAARRERLGDKFRESLERMVDLLGKPNVSDFLPGLARFDLQGIEKEMRAVLPEVEGILDSVIQERMEMMAGGDGGGGSKEKDFVGILLELKKQRDAITEETLSFGLRQIKAILMDIVVGGTDTTATIVEWVMAELLHRPHIMQRVQQELANVVGFTNVVEESHLPKLHYLDAVMKESFRLHPPVPLLVPRLPSESCTVGGYTIPKGSRIFLNIWSIHLDPLIWEDPLEFKPDRFLNDSAPNFDYMGNNLQYLPFGSGRRVCPGLPLGERMVMYLVATLVHLFDWRLSEGQHVDMSEKFGIVMRKSVPLVAVPYRRLVSSELYA